MKELEILKEMQACAPALVWLAEQETYEQAWRDCPRGDWMLWLVYKEFDGSDLAHRKFTLAKARCAKTVFHLMQDERSQNGVLVAEKYGLGEATIEELKAAAAEAAAAADEAAYNAYEAYNAADEAAAAAAAADEAAAAADEAYEAADDAYKAAEAAAAGASASADAAYADKKENQMLTANIVREFYPEPPKLE